MKALFIYFQIAASKNKNTLKRVINQPFSAAAISFKRHCLQFVKNKALPCAKLIRLARI